MQKRTALELAIEAGDWDKVGEAVVELDDLSYNGSEMMTVAAVKGLRASELDKIIGKVLWQRWDNSMNWEDPLRVVHLVLRLLLEERKRWLLGNSDTDGEGSCAAADWVIARSLSPLQRAERNKGQLTEGPPQTTSRHHPHRHHHHRRHQSRIYGTKPPLPQSPANATPEAYCAKEAAVPGIIVPSAREQWSTSRVRVLLVAKHPNVIDCLVVRLESSSSSQ
eukprot:scaffold66076_cov31-Attheya_sp.AAC.4